MLYQTSGRLTKSDRTDGDRYDPTNQIHLYFEGWSHHLYVTIEYYVVCNKAPPRIKLAGRVMYYNEEIHLQLYPVPVQAALIYVIHYRGIIDFFLCVFGTDPDDQPLM